MPDIHPKQDSVIKAMLAELDNSQATRANCALAALIVADQYSNDHGAQGTDISEPDQVRKYFDRHACLEGVMSGLLIGVLMEPSADGMYWKRLVPDYARKYIELKRKFTADLGNLGIEAEVSENMLHAMEREWLKHFGLAPEQLEEGQRKLEAAQLNLPATESPSIRAR